MTRKEYNPVLAARVKKGTHDYIINLAKRRAETISNIVATAIYEYVEKCKRIEKSLGGKNV